MSLTLASVYAWLASLQLSKSPKLSANVCLCSRRGVTEQARQERRQDNCEEKPASTGRKKPDTWSVSAGSAVPPGLRHILTQPFLFSQYYFKSDFFIFLRRPGGAAPPSACALLAACVAFYGSCIDPRDGVSRWERSASRPASNNDPTAFLSSIF